MNARTTQIEAYKQIKEEGLLSKLRFTVYEIIYNNQPINISQMIRKAASDVTNTGSFTGRISELERMGVIKSAFEDTCPITGRNVNYWVTTDELPKEVERKKTTKELLVEMTQDRDYWKSECMAARKKLEEMEQAVEYTTEGQGRLF